MITCDRFITTELVKFLALLLHIKTWLTVVVNMLTAGIAVPKSCDVQVRLEDAR